MAEPYSSLEVASNEHVGQRPEVVGDSTISAPERNLPNDAPELDKRSWPSQLSPSSEHPSLRPNFEKKNSDDAPETGALGGNFSGNDTGTLNEVRQDEAAPAATAPVEEGESPQRRRYGTGTWLLIGLAALVALGITLGVGLGVGLTRNKGSKSPGASAPASSPSSVILPHGLQNDTSVAVVALSNGDKRLFFQENAGNIRESLFTNSTQQWRSDVNNIVATNAKNSTPLASLFVNRTGTGSGGAQTMIYLFYIAKNDQLASRIFVSGTWATRDNFSPAQESNATFETPRDSRALAITKNTNSSDSGAAFVFYVARNGIAKCLSVHPDNNDGIVARPGPVLPAGVQGDHILALAAGVSSSGGHVHPQVGVLISNGTVEYSLYFSFFINGSWSQPELQTILVPPLPANQQPTLPTTLTLADAYAETATSIPPAPTGTTIPSHQSAAYNESLIGDVSLAQVFITTTKSNPNAYTLFGFWVNGTSLAAYTTKNIGLSGAPTSPFPFSRLAATTVRGGGKVFLYHQLNATDVAEDVYDTDGGFFTTSFFGVQTS